MAADEVVRLPVHGENGTRSIELPEGWLESTLVEARRIGRQVVLEPLPPEPEAPAQNGEDEIAWRYVDGHRVHPSWPPGYIEWLLEMQKTGELDLGDPDELRLDFEGRSRG